MIETEADLLAPALGVQKFSIAFALSWQNKSLKESDFRMHNEGSSKISVKLRNGALRSQPCPPMVRPRTSKPDG